MSTASYFPGLYFPVFRLIGRFTVNLQFQSEYRKIQTRKNSLFGHFSHSAIIVKLSILDDCHTFSFSVHINGHIKIKKR